MRKPTEVYDFKAFGQAIKAAGKANGYTWESFSNGNFAIICLSRPKVILCLFSVERLIYCKKLFKYSPTLDGIS